jgi:beta-1,4-mannosyl-glycoprotein beta-1,4-N-acetylglucosaminyltransferase
MFFNEIELLEIRLNILDPYVDYFVIVESTVTFSGNKKPLYFLENSDRFSKYKHKIKRVVIDDTPDNFTNIDSLYNLDDIRTDILNDLKLAHHIPKHEPHWCREFYQRECIKYGLVDCDMDDLIIFSDLDEIPDPDKIPNKIDGDSLYHAKQRMYQYYANVKKHETWYGTKFCKYSYIKTRSLNAIRSDKNFVNTIDDCGWHFTYLGGVENIKLKIQSYGHQELNRPDILNTLEQNIKNNADIFYRNDSYFDIDINTEFPLYLIDELKKFPGLLK